MKKILITGSTGCIGSQIVESLADKRVEFFLPYLDEEKRRVREHSFQALPAKINFLKADLMNSDQLGQMLDKIAESGGVDVVIHCVSLPLNRQELITKEWVDFESHLALQVRSWFAMVKSLIPMMKQNGKGKFINILTEAVIGRPPVNAADYIMSKYALLGLSKCLAVEYARFNITCNCVSPGLVKTDLTKDLPDKMKELIASQTPLKRIATVKDVVGVVKFLCSDEADFITGENILVDGGFVMK